MRVDGQLHARARAVRERGQVRQTGGGPQLGLVGVGSEDAEHAAHLGERRPARRSDQCEGLLGLLRVAGGHRTGHLGAHRDDGQMMGHHVVELPGDPQAFVRHGLPGGEFRVRPRAPDWPPP